MTEKQRIIENTILLLKKKGLLKEGKKEITKDNEDEIKSEMSYLSKVNRKKFPAKSDDEIKIIAAKEIAKSMEVKYQDVLKLYTPSRNIKGSKSWDKKTGEINIVKESRNRNFN